MKIISDGDVFGIVLSRAEMSILNNALNNIPQAVSELEYTTLIGARKSEVTAMLDLIHESLGERQG
jgi:hypothetical protein